MSVVRLSLVSELTPGIWVIGDGENSSYLMVTESMKVDGHLFAAKLMDAITTALPEGIEIASMPKHFGQEVLVHDEHQSTEFGKSLLKKGQLSGQHGQWLWVDGKIRVTKAYVMKDSGSGT